VKLANFTWELIVKMQTLMCQLTVVGHRHETETVNLPSTSATFNSLNPVTDEVMHHPADDVKKKHLEGQEATKGAVIALSFGIALTVILAVFAACHFCRGRRGSWKGRRLNVDSDADYLVDGMYL